MKTKTHKRKKSSRFHGRGMGTCGSGARKNNRKSGHHGGKGMSGSGKRADHKKTMVNKLYGHGYFGKKGITSKKTQRDKRKRINLQQIQSNLRKYGKKVGDKWEINLKDYKILGEGEIKEKLIIKAKEASKSAIDKVKVKYGEITLPVKKIRETKKVGNKSKEKVEKKEKKKEDKKE